MKGEEAMRKTTKHIFACLALGSALALSAYAGTGSGGVTGARSEFQPWRHVGKQIHKSMEKGHEFAYQLLDMREKIETLKGMKGIAMEGVEVASHHLMLFIMGPDGKMVTDATVGFKVEGPDGSEQKVMGVSMTGGFGADVDLKATGTYSIKMKAIVDDATLMDQFTYEMN